MFIVKYVAYFLVREGKHSFVGAVLQFFAVRS